MPLHGPVNKGRFWVHGSNVVVEDCLKRGDRLHTESKTKSHKLEVCESGCAQLGSQKSCSTRRAYSMGDAG